MFAVGGMFVAVFVRTLPSKWFDGINIFSEDSVDEEHLDATLISKLRRSGTLRIGSVHYDIHENKKSV